MINRGTFFDKIRLSLFNNHLSDLQVSGIEDVLDYWETLHNDDIRQLAYILATIFHETGETMQPIKERGGEAYLKEKPYYPYYGRDLCQTTWKYNYEKVKQFTGIDVVKEPHLIGQMPLAAKVAVQFMLHGWYTGKRLSDYINDDEEDFINARRIINGKDKAMDIADYAIKFYEALK